MTPNSSTLSDIAPEFDAQWYASMYPEVSSLGISELEHYRTVGRREGKYPTKQAYAVAMGFDRDWYLRANPDVAQAGIDAFDHYLAHGKQEGRHANAQSSFTLGQLEVLEKGFHLCESTQPIETPSVAQNRPDDGSAETPPFNSAEYWAARYRHGGNSGAGSYGRLARFKADTLNAFVREKNIRSLIEFGCGDGAQLSLADYPQYLGVDVAIESVRMCQDKFGGDESKSFVHAPAFQSQRADVTLSLDVIFHLVEDRVFHDYMCRLFRSSNRYVVIYSSNSNDGQPAPHVRHRRFTDWIDVYHADFQLIRQVLNPYPPDQDPQNESFADFYIYERGHRKPHGLPGELVISLTSYPRRYPTLELTLRRILQQNVQADRTILWVSPEDRKSLPAGVLALECDGLTIGETGIPGSYRKIIPTLQAHPDSFIVTLDDDTAYPPDVVEHLVKGYERNDEVLCRRAHRVTFGAGGEIQPYNQWQFDVADMVSVPDLFPTGVGGVLYPPRALDPQASRQEVFSALAPVTDDVWLYWMEWLAGSKVRRVGPRYLLQSWPGCDAQGLWANHNSMGGNDAAMLALTARYGSPFGAGHMLPRPAELPTQAPLSNVFKRFVWSGASRARNQLTCQYEPLQPFLLLRMMALAGSVTLVDVGANIGAYSVLSTLAPDVKTVHAFEVEEAAYAELRFNIFANRLEDTVTPHCVAISDHEGEVIFGVARPMAGNNGVIETSFHSHDVYAERRVVQCTTLDSLLRQNNESIALKIDIEGHELQALRGSKSLLSNNRCIIQIEIYESDGLIPRFLGELGYRSVFTIGPDHYFSNIELFFDPETVLAAVSSAMGEMVRCSLNG